MNILLIKTSSLGDIIHTFPALAYLREKFPEASIDWVVERPFSDLVSSHPLVNQAILVDTKAWRKKLFSRETFQSMMSFCRKLREKKYDVVFDFQANTKSGLVCLLARAKNKVGFGLNGVSERTNLLCTTLKVAVPPGNNVRVDNLFLAKSFFKDLEFFYDKGITLKVSQEAKDKVDAIRSHPLLKGKPKVMVCPGSAWQNKQLNKDTLLDFLVRVKQYEKCAYLFVWGNPEEEKLAQELQKCFPADSIVLEKMTLPMLQNLMGQVDLVFAMDSLPLHLAGTTKTPTFSFFGASWGAKYNPMGEQNQFFQGSCPYGRKFDRRCPVLRTCSTGACIRNLTAQELFASYSATKSLSFYSEKLCKN